MENFPSKWPYVEGQIHSQKNIFFLVSIYTNQPWTKDITFLITLEIDVIFLNPRDLFSSPVDLIQFICTKPTQEKSNVFIQTAFGKGN